MFVCACADPSGPAVSGVGLGPLAGVEESTVENP